MDSAESTKVGKRAAATRGVAKTAKSRKADSNSLDRKEASKRIDEKIAELADWRGERLAEIRKLIHAVDPDVG